jgi:PAS domain S-box-containing protein
MHKDGKTVPIELSVTSLLDAEGQAIGRLGVARDITERKRAEKALIRNERIARERARLLIDLRNLDRIDNILTRVCEAVRDSGLFERAVMTLHDQVRQIVHLGQVGLPPDVVKRARQAPPIDQKMRARVTSKKFRISDSFFIPAEAGVEFSKSGRYVTQKRKNSVGGDWQPGDELFVPLRDFSGKIMGYLSVDTPTDGCRPDIKTIEALEMMVEAAASRVREVEAQESLRESEEKHRELVNTSVDGVISVNPQMKIILWNPGAERIFGYTEKEALGQSLMKIVPERYRKAKEKGFVEFRKIGVGQVIGRTLELEGLRKDGTEVSVGLSVSSRRIGETYIATSIVRDISDRKRAEEALQRSERKYRTLVETAQEGIGIVDQKENLIFVNQAFADLLGYRKDKLLGKNLKEISDKTQYSIFQRETEKRKKGEFSKYEAKLLTKSGKPKYFYVSAAPLLNEDGSFIGTLGVLSDLTDIKKAREYNILLDTSRALSRTLKIDRVLRTSMEKMIQVLKADRCAVLLTEDDRIEPVNSIRVYPLKKGKVLGDVLKLRITKEHFSAYKSSLQKQRYVQIFDALIDPVPELGRKILRRIKINSALIIPILAGKKMLGVFHVGMAKKSRTFSTEEVRLALTMANQMAVALENCKLMEDLKREHSRITEQAESLRKQTREKDILLQVSRALSKTINLDEVSEVASHVVGSAMGVERCAVTLASEDGNQLEIKGLFSKEQADDHKLIGTKFLCGDIPAMTKAIKKGKPFVINDTSDIPSKSKTREYFLKVGIKSVLGTGMFFGKKLVGILSITSTKERKTFTQGEIKLVQTMANQIAVAIENARLLQVVKKHTQDLRELSSQLMKVQENERKRIAQELHDEVGQMLQSMKMNLDRIKRNLSAKPRRLEGVEDWLLDTEKLLADTIDDIRTLTFDLRPSMLDDFGLIPTLRWYVENHSRRSNIQVSLKTKDKRYRFPPDIEVTLYRIIQEALTNVSKHAKATEASVSVSQKNSTVILSVRDNGIGFDTSKVLSVPRGIGLLNIKERINLLGGSFEIISRPRKGTILNINIPFSEVKHEEGQITGG